jgi:hypothetical protein
MDVVLNPKQIVYAHEAGLKFNQTRIDLKTNKKEPFVDSYISVNEWKQCKDYCPHCKELSFCITVNHKVYTKFPAEMRALSSPEPKAPAPIMKKDYTSTQAPIATEPQGEPDYKALALLLIDLFEEKADVDARIAAVKAKLQG